MLYVWNTLKKGCRFIRNSVSYIWCLVKVWFILLLDKKRVYNVKSPYANSLFFTGGIECNNAENMTGLLKQLKATIKANPVVTYTKGKHNRSLPRQGVLDVRLHDDVIVELKNGKVGISVFKRGDTLTMFEVLRRRKKLEKHGAGICIAYFYNMTQGPNTYLLSMKTIGRCGYGAVIGLRPFLLPTRRLRAFNLKNTYLFPSLGDMIDKPDNFSKAGLKKAYKHIAVLEFGFDFKKKFISQQRYYPLNIKDFDAPFPTVSLCSRYSKEKEDIRAYNHVKINMKSFHSYDDEILLKTIFNWIGTNIPHKWEYLQNYSCGSICTRTFEIAPGNIYFFRPQFHDPNDKQTSELIRLKLVFRAVVRKSLFIFSYRKLPWFIPHIVLPDVNEAHIRCIAQYRNRLNTLFVGITGSIGKTSTKDMLFNVLNKEFNTDKSAHNSNVQVHIGLKMQTIKAGTEFFIQEIGGGRPGGASRHSRMILPYIAMVTNIGTAHIGNFDSQYELMRNKLGIADGLDKNGFLALNYDDPLLKDVKPSCRFVSYAVDNHNADYYADNIIEDINGMTFDIVNKGVRYPINLHVHGVHNALNAAGCFAVGKQLGISSSKIISGINAFETEGIRQNLINYNGYHLLIDCYNASVESINSSLHTITSINPTGKTVAIIGDVTGTGDSTEVIDKRIAEYLSEFAYGYDKLILFGNNAKDISKMLGTESLNKSIVFSEQRDLELWIINNVKQGDLVLFKGSSKMHLDEVIDRVYGTAYSDEKFIHSHEFGKTIKGHIRYISFKSYASVIGIDRATKDLVISNALSKRCLVTNIASEAFRNNVGIERISGGSNIKGIQKQAFDGCASLKIVSGLSSLVAIGESAFANCTSLREVEFPNTLRFINNCAFENCTAIGEIKFSNNLESIGAHAFNGCVNLRRVYIPAKTIIDESAFEGCVNVEIVRF